MNLSFKDIKFIIEALNQLINTYNERLEEIEHNDEDEDESSELGNDALFLESLCTELVNNLEINQTAYLAELSKSSHHEQGAKTKDALFNLVIKLSINERLLLVEAISESIRNDSRLKAS